MDRQNSKTKVKNNTKQTRTPEENQSLRKIKEVRKKEQKQEPKKRRAVKPIKKPISENEYYNLDYQKYKTKTIGKKNAT